MQLSKLFKIFKEIWTIIRFKMQGILNQTLIKTPFVCLFAFLFVCSSCQVICNLNVIE